MKIELETPQEQDLSLERKIKMHEAREAIIDRLARDLPTNIELERFLRVVVSEIGRMMQADRCDLLQLTDESELRISHEWRKIRRYSRQRRNDDSDRCRKTFRAFRYYKADQDQRHFKIKRCDRSDFLQRLSKHNRF